MREANAELPARQREVLALRELEQLSYEQIGELVGLNSNAVAQLISRARIRLRDLVRGGALESIAASSPECERALPLLARIQDDQGGTGEELDWVRTHVASCETCRLSSAAMEEAGVSYRALGPIVPLAWLRHTTIARAAQLVGADWSQLAGSAPSAPPSSPPPRPPGAPGRRLLWPLLGSAVLCVIAVVALAGSIARERRVSPQRVTSVSSATGTAYPIGRSGAHATRLAHHRRVQAKARLAQGRGSALAAVAYGGRGLLPSVLLPASRPAPRRRSGQPWIQAPRPSSAGQAPERSAAPAPASTTPTATTPTATTPAPSPASGEASGGGSTSSTPAPETHTSTEGGRGCELAIAC